MATLEIEEALYYKLINTAAITALVGTRIYPDVLPNGCDLPALTYQKISNSQSHNSGQDMAGESPRFQVSIWAETPDSKIAVKKQVLTAIRDATGHWGTGSDYLNIQRCLFEDENDLYDENMKVCGRALDFIIWHD